MNSKGFNLFTAMVSFVIIMLSGLLIFSMIQSERTAAETIAGLSSRNQQESFADTAIADAVQVFNFELRNTIADYITSLSSSGITLNDWDASWDQIIKDFTYAKFGDPSGTQVAFADKVADQTRNLFYGTRPFGSYKISFDRGTSCGGSDCLTPVMRELIKQTVTNGNFFEVVDCPKGNPWECDLGTFYVTLSVGNLRAEDYESLPKLVVRNGATGDEIKTVVLPYSNYKLYVPLRLFKAIATARGLAHFSMGGQEDIDGLINQPNDAGLMSTKTKQELGAKKLGMCDSGSCSARTNPGTATSGGMDKPCPSDNQTSTAITINLTGVSGISTTSYNANFTENGPKPPGSPNSGPEVLKKIIEQDVCKKVADAETSTYYVNGTDFVTQGTSPSGCGNNSKIELKQADTIKTATKQLTIVQGANTFPQTIPPGPPSYCAELDETKTVVAIEDQSENYRVKKNTPMIYRLNLTQSFADEKIKDPPLTGNPPVPGNAGWKCTSEEKMVTTGIGIDWVGNTCNP